MKIGPRTWILIILLAFAVLAISPRFSTGVAVKNVERGSELFNQSMSVGEIIKQVNGINVENRQEYTSALGKASEIGGEYKIEITTNKGEYAFLSNETTIPISVEDIPRTNIQTGLDLRGGARALVSADSKLNDQQLNDLVEISRNRFNVYGLSDVNVRGVTDLEGNKYMLIEVAGATPNDLENLIAQQGKFEAKVGNQTVFTGEDGDISGVCRNDASCSGIRSCSAVQGGGYTCSFMFAVYLTEQAAKRHADITRNIPLDETKQYLIEKLYLYVDEQEVDSLYISAGLRGQQTTEISIQGSGSGATNEDALKDAKDQMKKLQTILITGSLPYKLKIEKLDTISPVLGNDFTRIILLTGIAAIVLVSLIVFVRYRKIKASLALLFTSFSEIVIIVGIAALIKWNLDLPSIAGILATIGTGVDQQIVILDEAVKTRLIGIKERMKRALFVIVGAYSTSLVSLLPLYWASAGLFRGFAFTTIIGITVGVLVSRPAFAEIVRKIEE